MARLLWLNWSGGGNLPPSLGIARVLTERGHEVVFAGRPEMVGRVEAAGFRAIELSEAYAQLPRYPKDAPQVRALCYLTAPAVEGQVAAVLRSERPELVLIDQMFLAALHAARDVDVPAVLMCHTLYRRHFEVYRSFLERANGLRVAAGFEPLPPPAQLWAEQDLVVTTSLATFDVSALPIPHDDRIRHVGPALEIERHATPADLPWRTGDSRPLVVVSFSTAPEQGSVAKFQRTLDALAPLDVRAVVTVGRSIDPASLEVSGNAAVFDAADHEALMGEASAVITHGGHGTLMRALKHGLPMLVMPGMAADQSPNGAMIEELGAGVILSQEADRAAIRAAAERLLGDDALRVRARALSRHLRGVAGEQGGADEIERLLVGR